MCNNVPCSPLSTRLSGSAKEVELRIRNIFQWKKKRPPLWAMVLTALAILSCGSLVSCQGREAEEEPPAPAVEEPPAPNVEETPAPIVEEPPARTVEELAQRLQYDPDNSFHTFLDGLDLDGVGDHDDSVFIISGHSEEIPYSDLTTQVTVLLGTGQELTKSYPVACRSKIFPLYLTSSERQSLIIEMEIWNTNYNAAQYPILEVEDGLLVEQATIGSRTPAEGTLLLSDETLVISGALVQDREDSPLQALRVPVLLDKWHEPYYYTLTWDGARFSIVPDDYFIDTEVLSLPNEVELTLELVGHWYRNDGSRKLYYSEVRVLEGDTLLQTITPQSVSYTHLDVYKRQTWSYKGSGFPEVLSLHLTSPDFQSLVLEVDDRTSNYGAACYFVLEVEDGALVERAHIGSWEALESDLLPEEAVLYGALAQDREDSPLQALRVPVLLDKWHAPCYYTLTWDGARFSIVPDDFFIDTEVLSLPNEVELTLELVGHWYLNDGSLDLYYSEVRVLEGDALLQTITPQFPLPQPRVFDEETTLKVAPTEIHYPLHGFNTDFVYHTVDTRDINFDGCPDLGICCDDNSCAIHAWYLWDESSRQFQYAFPLYGDLILDESAQRLIEVRWGTDLNLYHYIEGQLCWIDPDSP